MAEESLCPVGRSCSHCSTLGISYTVRIENIDLRALFENWSIFNVNVKEMYFLIVLGDDTLIVDPNQAVLESLL